VFGGWEAVVEAATSGQVAGADNRDQIVPEESGGPFIETGGGTEFGYDIDASNPRGAKREPFPTT
jgi:hypothetical protein